MRRIRDCLRLNFEASMNQSQISRTLKIGRGTVQSYLSRFIQSGLSWETVRDYSDEQLESSLFKKSTNNTTTISNRPLPDFKYIHKEMKRPSVTLQLLWEEYIESNPDGLKRSQFCWHYNQWRKKQNGSMRQIHKGGEKAFVDYSGKRPEVIDLKTGEIRQVELFVMCWGASHYLYAEAQESQALENWTMGHVRAFEYFGCVPQLVVPDNLKSGVNKACIYDPDINRTYQELSQHYGFGVLPARPVKPKDKAKVENGVQIIQRWILARLRNRRFFNLMQLNQAISELVEECNKKLFQKVPHSREELFKDLDKPNALNLAENRFEFCQWYHPTISPDYHIEIDKCYYSVPWEYYGKSTDVRLLKQTVEVYHGRERIAVHQRSSKQFTFTTNIKHLPERHQRYAWWTLENIMKRSREIGKSTEKLIDTIIKSKIHPLQGYRPAQGILRLANTYGETRLESACSVALEFGFTRVRQISDMLKNGRDKLETVPQKTVKNSRNVRGKDYYIKQQELQI